jgi:hypothetical protein
MTTNSTTQHEPFPKYPGLFTDLQLTFRFDELPLGIEFIPTLASRNAFTAMKKMENYLGIQIVATDSFFIPDLKLSTGDLVEFPTNYGFYCDSDQRIRIATCVLLMSTGAPNDNTRVISKPRGMTVRILSERIVNRTTLVIVPEASMNLWLEYAKYTPLAHRALLRESDLEIYSAPEEIEIIKALINLDVIFLSSTIYQEFSYVFRDITWGRLIIEESLDHPDIINSACFRETAEFTWYLTSDPSFWINHPKVSERFLSRRIYQDDENFPEIFSIRNNPEFMSRCLVSPPPFPPVRNHDMNDSCHTEIDETIASITAEHCQARIALAHSYHRICETYRDNFYRNAIEGSHNFHNMISKINLETFNHIIQMIKRRDIIDETQKQVLYHNINIMQTICRDLINKFNHNHQTLFNDMCKKTDNSIISAFDMTQNEDKMLCESYVNRMTQIVDHLITNQHLKYLAQKCSKWRASDIPIGIDHLKNTIPVYLINKYGKTIITYDHIRTISSSVPPKYILAYGQANIKLNLNVVKEIISGNIIIGLVHGIQVLTNLKKKKQVRVMLISPNVSEPLTDYHSGIQPISNSDYIYAETILIGKGSTFTLSSETKYITFDGVKGVLRTGATITLA